MDHVPSELLELYAQHPERVADVRALEVHVAICSACAKTLQAIREFSELLADPETWAASERDPADRERAEELRAYRERSAAEDREAQVLFAKYQSTPISQVVWDDLASVLAYRTGGVVRYLCKWANEMCERSALAALALAEVAVRISAALDPAGFPRNSVHGLRGDALKEQANALRFLGRLPEALEALDQAEAEYEQMPLPGVGTVAVPYIRATVLFEQDRFDDAERLARESERAAVHIGEVDRAMRARQLQGEILYERGDFRKAAEEFRHVYAYGEAENDRLWMAREALNLGWCYIELGDLEEARRVLDRALTLFSALQFEPEVSRTHWALGRLYMRQGIAHEGIRRLRACMADFTRHELMNDAALVAIDLAEMLDATSRSAEIPRLLSGVVETFTRAGKLTGALTALAYLRTAAANGTMTPVLVAEVRRFVARADRHPDAIFAPPPLGL